MFKLRTQSLPIADHNGFNFFGTSDASQVRPKNLSYLYIQHWRYPILSSPREPFAINSDSGSHFFRTSHRTMP